MILVSIDLETGGAGELQCITHAVLSLGAAVTINGTEQSFHELIHPYPGLLIDPEAVKVNGYSPREWALRGARPESEAAMRFLNWLASVLAKSERAGGAADQKLTFVAHNAGHDRGFLSAMMQRQGKLETMKEMVHRRWRCSCAALGYLQDAGKVDADPGASLDALTSLRTGAPMDKVKADRGRHDALHDARRCLAGYEWMADKLQTTEFGS